MGNIELCLLGKKGHPKRISKNIKQLIIARRTLHSKKPDIIRDKIVELMGDLPRVELFARGDREKDLLNYNKYTGWDIWGNEVESDIEI
jgi:site-specific DNA-methyltransferase (adenine-specific)